jgi:hypothetical protein
MKVRFEFEVWQDDDGKWNAKGADWSAWGFSVETLLGAIGDHLQGLPTSPAEWLATLGAPRK